MRAHGEGPSRDHPPQRWPRRARAYDAVVLPEYACALIVDDAGRLVLQLRPDWSRHAAGLLTCFGGRLERGEDDRTCLRRELDEELGWRPTALTPACELWRGPRFIARFFVAACATPLRAREPGHVAIVAPASALPGLPLSPWHACAIAAWRGGSVRVELD